jgi:uncharacterized membrane protein
MRKLLEACLFIAAVGNGLFAGLLLTFWLAVDPMLATLTATEYAKVQQALIKMVDRGVLGAPLFVTLFAVAGIVAAVLLRKHPRSAIFRYSLAGALLFFFCVMVYTIVLNVPINEYVLTWNPAAPPADWANARDRWDTLNDFRLVVNLVSFWCFLQALRSPRPPEFGA